MKKVICFLIVAGIHISLVSNLYAFGNTLNKDCRNVFQINSDFPELEQFLSGKQLYRQNSYSSNTTGGGGWFAATEINIYGDHTFSFWSEDVTYGDFPSEKKDQGQGYWDIITGNDGQPVIQAKLYDGRLWYFTVRASGKDLYLNNKKYAYKDLN